MSGTKSTTDSDADKAIVIYKVLNRKIFVWKDCNSLYTNLIVMLVDSWQPGSHPQPPESNGSATQEESSK